MRCETSNKQSNDLYTIYTSLVTYIKYKTFNYFTTEDEMDW
jgi:hypothetical protein